MSLLIKGVTLHAALTDVNTPHLLAELENAVCSETEAAVLVAATNPTKVRKTADKTLNNVDVPENDDHLLLAVGANEIWQIDLFILFDGDAAADIEFGFSYPVGCLIYWGPVGAGDENVLYTWGKSAAADLHKLRTEVFTLIQGVAGVGQIGGIRFSLIIVNGANAGNVNLQWAQNTATVADTTVKENSCLIAHQLA